MKTFIVHVSVDAVSVERAEMLIRDCVDAGAVTGCIDPENGEVAVVLKGNTDEIEQKEED